MSCDKFDFEKEAKKYYGNVKVEKAFLKDLYNADEGGQGRSTSTTKLKGVYALFYQNELKKIGKATDKYGIFHRMSQYYRGDNNGGLRQITETNKDEIEVLYFNISEEEIWFAERRLQVIAHDCGETMDWENISRN